MCRGFRVWPNGSQDFPNLLPDTALAAWRKDVLLATTNRGGEVVELERPQKGMRGDAGGCDFLHKVETEGVSKLFGLSDCMQQGSADLGT